MRKEGYDLSEFNIPVHILKQNEEYWYERDSKNPDRTKISTKSMGTRIKVRECSHEIYRMKELRRLYDIRRYGRVSRGGYLGT